MQRMNSDPLTNWEEVNRVMRDADVIEKMARMRMERGNIAWGEALRWALEFYHRDRSVQDNAK